jgi:tRNA A-37 threonylcarbamoyl transferase component Bud32
MSDVVLRTPLKQGPGRSVHLERGPDGDVVRVVKRFHGAGPWSWLRDRTRSRREFEALRALHALGLPVPEPLERTRIGGVWEVAMGWLPDTVTLQSLFPARELWPLSPERLAAPLGQLLAGLHAAGLDHDDLHAGNVLVGPSGAVWAIDFHSARLRRKLDARVLMRDLVQLAAGAREFVPQRFRARSFVAWRRALPAALREGLDAPALLVAQVERQARERRRDVVRDRRRRWTRAGSAVRRVAGAGVSGFERVDLEPGWARELAFACARTSKLRRLDLPFPGEGARRLLVLRGGSYAQLRETWYAAARLDEHRIPVMSPLCLLRTPLPCAAFEVPRHALFLGEASPRELPPRLQLAQALGRVCGALHDRLLTPALLGGEHLLVTPRGDLCLAGIPGLVDIDPFDTRARRRDVARWRELVGGREPSFQQAFAQGYLEAWRGTRIERELLRRELSHG